MKLIVASDLHFGDPRCALVAAETGPEPRLAPGYGRFLEAAGRDNDYLVLLGDVFDFSIADYADAYAAARVFFRRVRDDRVAREVVYVPGNHDFGFWHVTMHEANVINRVRRFERPRSRWSVPAVFDDRPGAPSRGFRLPYVTAHARDERGGPRYGGLFLDCLSLRPDDAPGSGLRFNVAYPNVYLVTDDGDCALLTHGHYFEGYWAAAGEAARAIAGTDLVFAAGEPDIDELVAVNFPSNELASSGIGQAGPLTPLIRAVQQEVNAGRLERVGRYLDRVVAELDRMAEFPWYKVYLEWLTDAALRKARALVLERLGTHRPVRHDEGFLARPEAARRVEAYLAAVALEERRLNASPFACGLPAVRWLVFGHTHEALVPSGGSVPSVGLPSGRSLPVWNTGGWLWRPGTVAGSGPIGAAVLRYETGRGFSSALV